MVRTGDAFIHAEMQHVPLFAHLIHRNGMSFALNKHLGSRGPVTEQFLHHLWSPEGKAAPAEQKVAAEKSVSQGSEEQGSSWCK